MAFIPEMNLGRVDYFVQDFGDAEDRLPYSASRSIGYDDETDIAYFLEVFFDHVPGAIQFSFDIMGRDSRGREHRHWRRKELEGLFSVAQRAAIRNDLRALALAAVLEIRPQSFYMIAIDSDLPRKALSKYETLASQFAIVGYNITFTEVHGQAIWTMIDPSGAATETAT